jgi:hypothetical protein
MNRHNRRAAAQAKEPEVETNLQQAETEVAEQVIETPAPKLDAKGKIPEVTNENLTELYEKYKTKSAVIRYLASKNYSVGAIAKFMGIIYQHARNVLKQQPKKASTGSAVTNT